MLQFAEVLFKWGQAVDVTSVAWFVVLVNGPANNVYVIYIACKIEHGQGQYDFFHSFNLVSEWRTFTVNLGRKKKKKKNLQKNAEKNAEKNARKMIPLNMTKFKNSFYSL